MGSGYKLEDHCYVLTDINKIHPITHDRFEFLWYPERGMSMVDQMGYQPYKQSIVTECPWMIACYPRERVRVWDTEDGRGWIMPNRETYGASANSIIMTLLGFRTTIPGMVLDGGETLKEEVKVIADSYPKCHKR